MTGKPGREPAADTSADITRDQRRPRRGRPAVRPRLDLDGGALGVDYRIVTTADDLP